MMMKLTSRSVRMVLRNRVWFDQKRSFLGSIGRGSDNFAMALEEIKRVYDMMLKEKDSKFEYVLKEKEYALSEKDSKLEAVLKEKDNVLRKESEKYDGLVKVLEDKATQVRHLEVQLTEKMAAQGAVLANRIVVEAILDTVVNEPGSITKKWETFMTKYLIDEKGTFKPDVEQLIVELGGKPKSIKKDPPLSPFSLF